jgi:Na+/H+ antiporter NhaA
MVEQNFSNHAKFVPGFHYFVLPVFFINVGVQLYWWIKLGFKLANFFSVAVAVGLFVGFGVARGTALAVQNRVIRIEEQQRYARLLPANLQSRLGEFTVDQIVALRFASDAELPGLAQKVLDEKLTDRKTIKQMVKVWRPDHWRA